MNDDATAPELKCSAVIFFETMAAGAKESSDITQAFVDETISYFKAMPAADFSAVLDSAASGLALGDGHCAIDPGRHLLHHIAARVLAGEVLIPGADPLEVTSLLLQNLKSLEHAASVVRLNYYVNRCLVLIRSCSKPTLMFDEFHIRTADFFEAERFRKEILAQQGMPHQRPS